MPYPLFSLNNLSLYFIFYGFISFFIMFFIKSDVRKKVLTKTSSTKARINFILLLSRIFRISLMVVSPFITFTLYSASFYIGTVVYFIGLTLTTLALWQYSLADLNKPITSGLYKVSRHPMQVMFYIMLIGISIVSNSLIFLSLVLLYFLSSYPMFKLQEDFCSEKYGSNYISYKKSTPRIL